MKPKMKYSTKKISLAKLNSTANKALVKSCKLTKSQKTEEVCHLYFMKLRSGLTIEKRACYFRKKNTKRPSLGKNTPKTGLSPITESFASLSTYNDQSVTFVLEDGSYEIYIEDLKKDQEKDKVLLRYYESQCSSSESGDSVDGKMLMVNLGTTKDHWLHANKKEHSVELHKTEKSLPEQAFFVLHKKPFKCVSFECKNDPGTFIGVKNNQLALIKVDRSESLSSENIMFKLSKT
uniref:Interleukin-33 n=1 Tax=Propithecus coquereli TaxID=379532 RepID=A0A2K6FKE0_PROCO